MKTWKWVEYAVDRVDELVLVESGAVVDIHGEEDEGRRYVVSHQVFIIFVLFFLLSATFLPF